MIHQRGGLFERGHVFKEVTVLLSIIYPLIGRNPYAVYRNLILSITASVSVV